jgi:hypothetical protein
VTQRVDCGHERGAGGHHVIDDHDLRRGLPATPIGGNRSPVIPPGSAWDVQGRDEQFEDGDLETTGQGERDLAGPVYPVPETSGGRARHRHQWQRRETLGKSVSDQVGHTRHGPVLEMVDEGLGGPSVLEGGDHPDPARKQTLGRRSQRATAGNAQRAGGHHMTDEAQHAP